MTISDKVRAKMREAKMGNRNPMFGKHRYGNKSPHFGKHHSEEAKEKIRKAVSGKNNGMHGVHRFGKDAPNWKGDKAKPDAGRVRAEKLYPCPQGLERHHIDGNTLNNNPENIKIVTVKEHRILDGRLDKLIEARRKKGGTKNKKS